MEEEEEEEGGGGGDPSSSSSSSSSIHPTVLATGLLSLLPDAPLHLAREKKDYLTGEGGKKEEKEEEEEEEAQNALLEAQGAYLRRVRTYVHNHPPTDSPICRIAFPPPLSTHSPLYLSTAPHSNHLLLLYPTTGAAD